MIDENAQFKAILESIPKLVDFGNRTQETNSTFFKYLSSVATNTAAFLCVPLNSISHNLHSSYPVSFVGVTPNNDGQKYLNSIALCHRTFYSLLLTCLESAIIEWCKNHSIEIQISWNRRLDSILKFVEPDQVKLIEEINDLKRSDCNYEFDDCLNAVLKCLSKESQKKWRKIFKSLRIIRNKVSHSNDICTLEKQTAFEKWVSLYLIKMKQWRVLKITSKL